MPTCAVDFETRSTVELKTAGIHRYAVDPTTDLWCLAYAFDGAEPELWVPGQPFPVAITAHAIVGGEFRAFNAQFERLIWWHIGVERYGFPIVQDGQWVCTAAEASAMALPRSLGQCAAALGIPQQKDDSGHRLMLQLARPRKVVRGVAEWWDTPEKLAKLYAYCQQDVRVERQVAQALRRLSPHEQSLYQLDQTINDRGIRIDRPLIDAMRVLVLRALEDAAATLSTLTDGTVTKPTQLAQMKLWLASQGCPVASLDKTTVTALLDQDIPPRVREVLELRAETARSSVAKLETMLECAGADDRMRGLLLYHGASTGRWTGKLVQPQNFPRPTVPNVEQFIPAVLAGDYELLDTQYPVLQILSTMLRCCLIPAEGHQFVVADYAGIEARIVNWIAGQWDIVQKFADGENVYWHNARAMAQMQGRPLPVTATKDTHPADYQAGKAVELGCGFQMGAARFETAAFEHFQLTISPEEAKQFVDFYRATHPQVKQLWADLQRVVREVVESPGTTQWVGAGCRIALTKRGGYLWIVLPSGRPLCYARPVVREVEAPWSIADRVAGGTDDPQMVAAVFAWGVNSQTRRWEVFSLYGGLLLENITQAIARDIMADGMLRVSDAGYPIVLTAHDEEIAESPIGVGSLAEFCRLLTTLPSWAEGGESGVPLPLKAEGWVGQRYRK